eukprot:XP_001705942.1 Hypothetical protein GL50803_99497 [Giardia lamblia ATCC 50803]
MQMKSASVQLMQRRSRTPNNARQRKLQGSAANVRYT